MQGQHHTGEFIGNSIIVSEAADKSIVGLSGTIIDETKKTFKIRTGQNTIKTVLKQGCTFIISGQKVIGDNIMIRPQDRIKGRK